MPQKWYAVSPAKADAPASVSVRGYIGEWGLTDRDLIREIEALGEIDALTVVVNSRGGEVDHALSIYNYLRTHAAKVTVRIDGIAASAASIIAMAGDEIIMPANALMMVHRPWTFAEGNAESLRKTAADLEKLEGALLETYQSRSKKPWEETKALIDEETYLSAADALEMGFCDVVEPLTRPLAVAMAEAVGVPTAMLAMAEKIEAEAAVPAEPETDPAEPEAAEVPPAADPEPQPAPEAVAREAAAEISAMCLKAGFPQLAADLIRKGVTPGEAARRLIDARAEADARLPTQSFQPNHPAEPEPHLARQQSWSKAFNGVKSWQH